jgi:hypothetical protein
MKSPLQDRKLQTNCKNCVFSTYENNTQVGCLHNRITKFQPNVIEAYDNEKEFYVINGLCNLYRSNKWNNGEADISKAMAESSLAFDCFIDCSAINDDSVFKVIDFITYHQYYANKINWYLFHLDNATQDVKNNVMIAFTRLHSISPKISVCVNKSIYLNEFILKSSSSYHCVINVNDELNSKIFTVVNDSINVDIKKFIVSKIGNVEFISNIAYRLQFVKDQNVDYYSNINNIKEQSKNIGMYLEI